MLRDFARRPFARRGVLNDRAMRARARRVVELFDIRTPSLDTPVRELSGGNQQKVVLARELNERTRVLIAAQPTRGLDVGAIEAVYEILRAYKARGGATLLISHELDEILSLADRIAVLVGGRFVDIIAAEEATAERLGLLMSGNRAAVNGSAPAVRQTHPSDALA
jgi:general nucleoside transport system ATP-binding protein